MPEKKEGAKQEQTCTVCGTVAKTEEEMCSHLRAKNGLPLKRDSKDPAMKNEKPQQELTGMPPKGEEAIIAEDILDLKDHLAVEKEKMDMLTEKLIHEMRRIQRSMIIVKGWKFEVDLIDKLTIKKKKK